MTEPLPDAAITAAVNAYNRSYLTSNTSNPRFTQKVVTAALEAAARALRAQGAAAERARIRQLVRDQAASWRDAAIGAPDPEIGSEYKHIARRLDDVADLLDGAP